MATYESDSRSKGNRLAQRTKYDAPRIHALINSTAILHVSFNAPSQDPGPTFPTILPMLGAIGQYPEGDEDAEPSLYLHGSSVARLFKITSSQEIPLCVAATQLDGYVLALAPFHNSCNYRSAVLFGYGSLVEDTAEVDYALKLITNNTIPARWENSRQPPTKSELTSTGVLRMRIETASIKTRSGTAEDEKHDLRNAEVVTKTWTGVVPTYMVLSEPVPNESNGVKALPEYLADWVADANSVNEQRAIDALEKDYGDGGE